MRTDIFSKKKCVHIKLDKNIHFALRMKLFKHNLSMQDLFNEIARLVAEDTPKGQSIVESIINKKVKFAMLGKEKAKKNEYNSDLDNETLYNMINSISDEA